MIHDVCLGARVIYLGQYLSGMVILVEPVALLNHVSVSHCQCQLGSNKSIFSINTEKELLDFTIFTVVIELEGQCSAIQGSSSPVYLSS